MKIHTLLLFLLATVMIISLQAMNFDQEEVLNEDDWFSECPAQNEDEEPLTCDYFKRTPYWLRALGSSDRKKEKLFRRLNYDDEQYENVRCKIAGWVCAGVNPNLKLEEGQFLRTLGRTVDNDDIPVTQFLQYEIHTSYLNHVVQWLQIHFEHLLALFFEHKNL